ncbi:Rieske (2Fe-2S) protein [Nocardioides insulae]|uniref:cytochrome bc1 complex Rieske iron-sulfur subunit n=1 Tax=Nocardioides insulae TaxID=394734 RepID=UPI00055F80E4
MNAHTDALLPDPGQPEHHWRPTDVDEKAEKRAERQVAICFLLSAICSVLFVVAYVGIDAGYDGTTVFGLGASNVALGLCLSGALLFVGVGVIQWARKLMADVEIAEDRHPAASSESDRQATQAALAAGLEESGMGRRPLLRNSLIGSAALLLAPAVVLFRDLGPLPNETADAATGGGLEHTVWKQGVRVVRDVVGTPIRPSDVEIGDLFNAEPEVLFANEERGLPGLHGVDLQVAKSKAPVVLLRMDPADYIPGPGREDWAIDGIVAYSKICTHVGCPISLNERTTHHLLCPCHQSTFDLADSGKVVFGPAGRHLPQLPLAVDDEGYLIAQSDFTEPIGPSYWERNNVEIKDQNVGDLG